MTNAIEIEKLCKSYKDFQLSDISFCLPKGTIMGLIGENGAGKSTIINLIMNSVKGDSGTVKVLGCHNKDKQFTQLKQKIGVVLDNAYYPEVITAANVNVIMKSTYKNWQEATFFDYIKRFDIPLKKEFKDFSKGMKMKLAIAVAFSHQPELLILDEATSGLDPIVRNEILDILREFVLDENHSILMSSHITTDLEKICDYITFVHKGKMVFCEEKDEILAKYALIKTGKDEFKSIPDSAIIHKSENDFGVEALVKNNMLSSYFTREHITIEDIILNIVKGDETK